MINVQLILELALLSVFNLTTEEKGLNADVFLEKLKSWELMNENNFTIISVGVRSFFNEDSISSLHVLVPQFEVCVRHMFVKAGAATSSIKKGMAQHEETFNEFLKREDVIQSLGDAVHKYIQFVMVEQSGMNLRNNIAHGLIKAEACNKSINVLVLHLFLVLTIYGLPTNYLELRVQKMPKSR
ncbi:DUF4209 domain-containing protein [Paenibacillus agaridevorans]|uniref:DUF4209 domain-containing protein n=1 Tax=Paenibacillus agaridevorans TaxID=171404 RepID=UPI001BE452FF|nr:DUF4209 domain-containing protein [Paenibacillus agaridevorans]